MQGVSRESLATVRDRLDQILADAGVDPEALADDLFGVVRLLDAQPVLRRVLTDPATSAERKDGLIRQLFDGKVGETTIDVLVELAGARWSAPRDLADATEELAVQSAMAVAERTGQLDELEDELFRFGRIVAAYPQLRGALADPALPEGNKRQLLRGLLQDRAKPATLRLVEQVVVRPRGRSLETALESYAQLVATLRQRSIAVVRVAIGLTDEERDRLAAVLRRLYGRDIQLNVEVDPEVIGGMTIQIGHEVIDGTVITRLEQARSRLAG